MEIKNIQLKVYQWYIKKGSLSIGIKGKKSLVRVQKRGKVPVRLHFSLKYDRMMCYTLCNGYKPLAYHDKEGWSRHE